MAKDAITTKFSIDISEFKKNISEANKQIKLANAEFKAASAGMDDWTKSTDGITAKLDQLDKTLTAQKAILESYKQQLQAQQSAYDENGKKAEELKAKLADLAKNGILATSDEYKKYVSALSDVEKEQAKNQTAIDKLNVQILNQEAAVKTTQKETDKYKDTLQDVQKAEDKAAKSGRSVEEELEDIGKSAEKTDSKLGDLAKNIAAGITASIAALGAAAVKAGKDMLNMALDVAKAGDEIDKESQKLGMSAENYQKLSYAMELSGASIDELRKGTVNITKALGAYEDEGLEAKQVDPFNKLNVSLVDAQGNLRTTDQVLLDTIDALGSMEDDVQRDIIANEIFGKTFTEIRPLINGGSQAIKDLMQEAEDYGMVMSDEAVKSSAEFEDSLSRMKGTIDGVKNRLGAELLPSITDIMDGISMFTAGIEGGEQKISAGIDNLIKGIKKAFPEIGKFINSLKNAVMKELPGILKSIASELVKALPQVTATLMDVIEQILDYAIESLPMIIDTMTSIILQIADSLETMLPRIIQKIVEVIPQIIKAFTDAIPELLQGGIEFFMAIVDALPEIIPALVEAVPEIVDAVSDALTKCIPELTDGALKLFVAIVDALPEIIPQMAKNIVNIVGSIAKLLIENVPVLADAAVKLFMGIVEAVPQIIPALGQAAQNLINVFEDDFNVPLRQMWDDAWKALTDGAAAAWDTIKGVFGAVAEFFAQTFGDAWERVKSVFSAGSQIFEGIKDSITDAFTAVVNLLITGLNMAIAEPFDKLNEFLNLIRNIDILGLKPFEALWPENPFDIPAIPYLAKGGVLRRGQVGLLEGDGAEAVVPLEKNKAWIRAVAADMVRTLAATNAGTAMNSMSKNVSFVQNNYSPKALSRLDIYRQTRNMTAALKGV